MSRTAAVLLGLLVAAPYWAAQTPKKQAAKKSTQATSKPPAATKKSTSTRSTSAAKKGTAKKPDPRRSAQKQPTPERYREIQEALAKRGYLASEPHGAWDDGSTSALRRFQQDQNLEPSGKIDALSLIALGLGPKRTSPQRLQP